MHELLRMVYSCGEEMVANAITLMEEFLHGFRFGTADATPAPAARCDLRLSVHMQMGFCFDWVGFISYLPFSAG